MSSDALSPKIIKILELAAMERCRNDWSEDQLCGFTNCYSCLAAEFLPKLMCACGKYELDRRNGRMWEALSGNIIHEVEKCVAPEKFPVCPTCETTAQPGSRAYNVLRSHETKTVTNNPIEEEHKS
jgi:hypothetical protein